MKWKVILSDHIYRWSDSHEPKTQAASSAILAAAQAQGPGAPISAAGGDPAGVAYRALQALRQPDLQMPAGQGARPQVLPLHQPLRGPSLHGVRPSRLAPPSRPVPGQLSPAPGYPRGYLSRQPRALAAPQALLALGHGCRNTTPPHRCHRRRRDGHPGGQHDRGLAESFASGRFARGGRR